MTNDTVQPHIAWHTRVWAFVKLGRPIFLIGGVVMNVLGAAMALYSHIPFDARRFILAQIAITATQLMTHYLNDVCDIEFDRANQSPTNWSGGSRVLVDGTVPATSAWIIVILLAAVALGAGIYLSLMDRLLALPIILLAMILAAAYSAPPARLHTRGVGELTSAIIVALLTPLVGFIAQTGTISSAPLLGIMPLIFFQFGMLYGVALPDVAGDLQSGKRTLAVRAGNRAGTIYIAALIGAYAVLPITVLLGLPGRVAGVLLLTLPIALLLIWRAAHDAWRDPLRADSFAFGSIALLVCAALTEILAFLSLSA